MTKASTREAARASETTIGMMLMNLPRTPPMSRRGRKAAMVVSTVAMTGHMISAVPRIGGFAEGNAALDEAVDVFADDDCVIDDEAEDQDHAEQHERIDGVAVGIDEDKRGEDGDGQADDDDKSGAQPDEGGKGDDDEKEAEAEV
jgi:hypothetical protein